MDYRAILNYFEGSAKTGRWDSLYNPKNPISYSFIVRLQKAINLAGSFKDKKVLDLGCGTGPLMPIVINGGGQYIGLDASEKMLSEIKRLHPSYIDNKNVRLILGDVSKSQLPDDIDIIIGLGFIEYIDYPETLVQGLFNKLSAGGRLILSFPNLHSLDCISVKLLSPLRYITRLITGKSTYQPPRRLWTPKKAKELYINSRLKDVELVNYNINILSYPFTRPSMAFTNLWAKRFEYSALSKYSLFATGFMVSGRK